jgi:hypothetical protein
LATHRKANGRLAGALSTEYAAVALVLTYRILDSRKVSDVPGLRQDPVLAPVLSAFVPRAGQGYNLQRLNGATFFPAGAASAHPLLSRGAASALPDSASARLLLATLVLGAVEILSRVDASRAARPGRR